MMEIYCCGCESKVKARLTDGQEIYPHRTDLYHFPFWKCDECSNFVGCHHKTKNRTQPLGCIPTKEIKEFRKIIHSIIDPLWKMGRISRSGLYKEISNELGWRYHTASIKSVEEAQQVLMIAEEITMRLEAN